MDKITLPKDTEIYKNISEKYDRQSIFDYNINESTIEECQNFSWFALNKIKALHYKTSTSTVHSYHINKNIKLLDITSKKNLKVFTKMINRVNDNKIQVLYRDMLERDKHFSHYTYIGLDIKHRAIYEYMFAFGFLKVEEQLKFVKLILKLQEYGLIKNLRKMNPNILMDNNTVQRLSRLFLDMIKFDIPSQETGHRYSLYQIDINVSTNLCMLFRKHFNGYILPKTEGKSYWHKNMIDLSEILLFKVKAVIHK